MPQALFVTSLGFWFRTFQSWFKPQTQYQGPSPEPPGLIKASGNRSHSLSMVCSWLYAVIVCLKAIAFLHVSLVDAKVHPKGLEFKSLKFCGSDHSSAKIEITPWPFIAYEHIFNITISITPGMKIDR
ncbi:hypothetical protein P5673_026294 [Acropora cervicornis]|uniref:Uncharacterized protein n=1 Tax=Acropora cervicornis TaxID=6130 RepID=A0AAD9UWU5_ACRCE|nr:hypothetical protein P5673_026294 [Acropora cervicornis]